MSGETTKEAGSVLITVSQSGKQAESTLRSQCGTVKDGHFPPECEDGESWFQAGA